MTLGDTQFYIDFYILTISGAEAVIGIQWLKALGFIVTDYFNLIMKFTWAKRDHLHGITAPPIKKISSGQLMPMQSIDSITAFYHLVMSNIPSNYICNFSSSPFIIQLVL